MKICIISDTHDLHRSMLQDIGPVDLLLHAGDWSFFSKSVSKMEDFNQWLGEQNARQVVITCGNHEFAVEAHPAIWKQKMTNAHLLLGKTIELMGLTIHGDPTTSLWSGAFGRSDARDRSLIYDAIPPHVDILLTHGPPQGILDNGQGDHVLLEAVRRIKPRIHAFGHVHSAYGTQTVDGVLYVNAAMLDEHSEPSHKPVYIEMKES